MGSAVHLAGNVQRARFTRASPVFVIVALLKVIVLIHLRFWHDCDQRQPVSHTFPDDEPYVFLGQKGRLTYNGLYDIIKTVGVKAGVDVRPHQFRHTFSITNLKSGISLAAVSRMLGHESVRTWYCKGLVPLKASEQDRKRRRWCYRIKAERNLFVFHSKKKVN